jgi:hypothetical protein
MMRPRRPLLLVVAVVLTAFLGAEPAEAQRSGLSLHPYLGLFDGGWAKIENSGVPELGGFRAEFSDGGTAGVRAAYGFGSHVALWASAELDVYDEGPFMAGFGGVAGRISATERLRFEGRVGAGVLAEAPFGLVGVGAEYFVLPWLSLEAGVELARPIGRTSRWNGVENVPIEFDGGPTRVQFGIGIHPGF